MISSAFGKRTRPAAESCTCLVERSKSKTPSSSSKREMRSEKAEADKCTSLADRPKFKLCAAEIKQRRDSIEQFKNGNRDDLVATEEEQLNVILKYLPKQLSEQEIQELIQEGIASVSAKSMQDMGKLMGHLKPKFEGKADMSIVSKLVKELLG